MTSAVLIVFSVTNVAYATDFAMPATIPEADSGGGKSKKSLVSKGTFKMLEKVAQYTNAGRIDEAFQLLNELGNRVSGNRYETAVVLKTAGYLYVERGEYKKAITPLKVALSLNALADENQQKLRYDLAQLFMGEGEFKESIGFLRTWMDKAKPEDISAANYARLATAYMQLEQHKQAIPLLTKAISVSDKPSEYYYQLLLASYVKVDDLNAAIGVLKQMISRLTPNKSHYIQLVGLLDEKARPEEALAVLELAYKKQLLDDTQEIRSLAQRYLMADYPYKAARVLQKGLDDMLVWITPENLTLLANAYMQAKEYDKAIPVLINALKTTDSAAPAQMLAQIYIERQQWEDAASALERGLALVEENDQAPLRLTLGYVLYESGKAISAKGVFTELVHNQAVTKKQRTQAKQWLAYLSAIDE